MEDTKERETREVIEVRRRKEVSPDISTDEVAGGVMVAALCKLKVLLAQTGELYQKTRNIDRKK